ncbi:alpha/beta hydrolase [Labrys sp. ZIDIC5]|uniref:alpha/beta hydrolase n=1 Tax=Labrys sedimenti TaxID=3106036 RepID=UPI002ACAC894|nr:dienelactone hydrolase family protein [Labrys sp. ZIDIC5]MDZ5452174.1 dienelactone hydrolase family protein [Labrys sp. ZIDIC5]
MSKNYSIATTGASLNKAKAAVILLHGRGAAAESMFGLADIFEQPDIAYFAPQAPGGTWYPQSFLAALDRNEPYLSSSLAEVGNAVSWLRDKNVDPARIALLGFSQGGCLALEFAARNASRYGAIIGLSAGLIGPDKTPRDYAGSLADTPVFLGCSDIDSHIPVERVRESSRVLSALGGQVVERIYPGMGHEINDDEVDHIRALLSALVAAR